jgi:hypothetical protein
MLRWSVLAWCLPQSAWRDQQEAAALPFEVEKLEWLLFGWPHIPGANNLCFLCHRRGRAVFGPRRQLALFFSYSPNTCSLASTTACCRTDNKLLKERPANTTHSVMFRFSTNRVGCGGAAHHLRLSPLPLSSSSSSLSLSLSGRLLPSSSLFTTSSSVTASTTIRGLPAKRPLVWGTQSPTATTASSPFGSRSLLVNYSGCRRHNSTTPASSSESGATPPTAPPSGAGSSAAVPPPPLPFNVD